MGERVVILGQSAFSLSIAFSFLRGGADVVIHDARATEAKTLRFVAQEQDSKLSHDMVVTNSSEVFSTASVVIANFGGSYDRVLLSTIAPLLKPEVLFVIFPGYFLAHTIQAHLRGMGVGHVSICEITSAPCVCELSGDRTLQVFKWKNRLKLSCLPETHLDHALGRLVPFLPMLRGAKSVIETSLENINSILHPLPILLNLPLVAKDPKQFRHFIDGIDTNVSRLLHLMDEERLRVGSAWDLHLEPVVEHLKVFYGQNDAKTIGEYIHTPECPYDDIRGYGLQSRYITLDVPHLIVPTIRLARERNVPTPIFDACYQLAKPFLPRSPDIEISAPTKFSGKAAAVS